jgi:hydroxymethylpyrimidine pyrophosphatase-like HAD family hydrolase
MARIRAKHPATELKITRAIETMPELCPPSINKAVALTEILKQNPGINASNVIAFGDGENDVEMLRMAGHGVAMANSMPAALEAADYVTTKTNHEGGVGHFLDAIFRPQ